MAHQDKNVQEANIRINLYILCQTLVNLKYMMAYIQSKVKLRNLILTKNLKKQINNKAWLVIFNAKYTDVRRNQAFYISSNAAVLKPL